MANFIDRRLNAKGKSTVNRQRFINRYKQQIKKAVSDAVTRRSVTDVDKGEKIGIPTRDISEPTFHQGRGGVRERVHPGNDQFTRGDKVDRPPQGGGQGSGQGDASNSGEGQDDFVFQISKDEYLELLFEDLHALLEALQAPLPLASRHFGSSSLQPGGSQSLLNFRQLPLRLTQALDLFS